jgi:hypothetical protein
MLLPTDERAELLSGLPLALGVADNPLLADANGGHPATVALPLID